MIENKTRKFNKTDIIMENTIYREPYHPGQRFKRSIARYLVVCSFLTVLNLFAGGGLWVLWVWSVWGLAIILQAVLASIPVTGGDGEYDSASDPRRSFYRHLCTYLFVMGMLALVNYLYMPAYPWVLWPAAGWGLGIALQAVDVFIPKNNTVK